MPDVLPLWVYKTKMFIVNMYILCLHESVHVKNIKYLSAFHRERKGKLPSACWKWISKKMHKL